MAQRSSFDLSLTFKTVKNTIKRMSMKKFNFIYLLLAFVGVVAMTSCEHPNADYTPGAKEDNLGVHFLNTKGFNVTADATSVDIKVARLVADEAVDVSVRAAEVEDAEGNTSGLFTLPSSVSFAAGETEANYTITFDASELEVGRVYSINVQLDQTEATAYAISDYVFTITLPEPWSDWGTGLYVDDFWKDLWALAEVDFSAGYQSEVLFQRHDEDPNRIRIVNPASMDVFGNLYGAVPGFLIFDESKDYYMEFDVTDPNNVKLVQNPVMLGLQINFSDGAVPACLYVPENEDGSYIAPITYVNGVIRFPQENVLLGIIDGGQLYMATGAMSNADGLLMYVTPGAELTDYTMAVSYNGMKVSADNTTAKALIEFAFAQDVEEYAFTIVEGDVTDDYAEQLAAIIDGTDESAVRASVEEDSWEIDGLAQGLYTIVAVPYAGGEAITDSAIAYSFFFNGIGSTPEVNIDVELGAPSKLVEAERSEEVEKNSPACYSVGVKIVADASQLKAIKYFVGNGASVDAAIEAGNLTLDQLFAKPYGGDVPATWMDALVKNGSVVGAINVTPGVKATVFLRFETIYGKSIDVRNEYTVPEYDGNFPVGAYQLTEGENSLIFNIYPGKSYTQFFWENTSFDESTWYVNYDEKESVLSMDGTEYMYESDGCLFGKGYAYTDQTKEYIYYYASSTTADFQNPTAPLQVKVGENGLEKLLTYYAAIVVKAADGSTQGSIFSFTPEATIAPYEEPEDTTTEPTTFAFSVSHADIATYAVEAVRVERGIVIKPFNGKFERNFQCTTIQR